jgi:hypothetical protein
MTSARILAGVAHDLAHHTQSSLSWIHPHIEEGLREAGEFDTTFELLADAPYPPNIGEKEALRLALKSLKQKFFEIADRNGFMPHAVKSALLTIQIPRFGGDSHTCSVRATITASNGHTYSATVE